MHVALTPSILSRRDVRYRSCADYCRSTLDAFIGAFPCAFCSVIDLFQKLDDQPDGRGLCQTSCLKASFQDLHRLFVQSLQAMVVSWTFHNGGEQLDAASLKIHDLMTFSVTVNDIFMSTGRCAFHLQSSVLLDRYNDDDRWADGL